MPAYNSDSICVIQWVFLGVVRYQLCLECVYRRALQRKTKKMSSILHLLIHIRIEYMTFPGNFEALWWMH